MFNEDDKDIEEDFESVPNINKSWAVGMIIPTLISLALITLAVVSN